VSKRAAQFPDITLQYGFSRIPVEDWMEAAMENRLEVTDIRIRWAQERLFKPTPSPQPAKCPTCGQLIGKKEPPPAPPEVTLSLVWTYFKKWVEQRRTR
jgi:hypothetical protein